MKKFYDKNQIASILPCIVAHSAVNMLSVVEANVEPKTTIIVSVFVSIVAIVSTFIYNKHIRPDIIKENNHNLSRKVSGDDSLGEREEY